MITLRKPEWVKKEIFKKTEENGVKNIINKNMVHTVCKEARCPNLGECFSQKRATFLLLGNRCTRNCRFCNISSSSGELFLDKEEPYRVASTIKELGLKYVVLTSVTRDDLSDGGVFIYIETIKAIKKIDKSISIEVLVPDFLGNFAILESLLQNDIVVFNHNLETVKRLYPDIRPMANYERSLSVLSYAKNFKKDLIVKSGIMVGLGEKEDEVYSLINDLKEINVDALTIGQYLQPKVDFYPVKEYVTKEKFDKYAEYAKSAGIKMVFSDVFVRSSYLAENFYLNQNKKI